LIRKKIKKSLRKKLGHQRSREWADALYGIRTRMLRSSRRLRNGLFQESNTLQSLEAFHTPGYHCFFGYYDIGPLDHNDTLLLACRCPITGKNDELEIGYFETQNPSKGFTTIDKTLAWSWQLGCRLQWYPLLNTGKDRRVIYNTYQNGSAGCCVRNLRNGSLEKKYQRSLFSISLDGKIGLSLNFSRLGRLRPGYGYPVTPDDTAGNPAPDHDGIWRVDMTSGKSEMIVSIDEARQMDPLSSMEGAEHYFNHIAINPDGNRFLFFHVWLKDEIRYTRLITSDMEGQNRFSLINEGFVSHYTWRNSNQILCYSAHSDTGRKYHLYDDNSCERRIVGKGVLYTDGHPSFSPDLRFLLTDTYPDRYGERHLLVYDLDTHRLLPFGSFFSPYHLSGHRRCDLHPRWSPSGKFIVFDSAHRGHRAIYRIPFDFAETS
jgi:hypothetical protein